MQLFFSQLCIALTIPLAPPPTPPISERDTTIWTEEHFDRDLATQLWDAGVNAKKIIKLPSHGCQGYWVDASDEAAWGTIIAKLTGAAHATIESFGEEPDDTPAVALVVSEGDDE